MYTLHQITFIIQQGLKASFSGCHISYPFYTLNVLPTDYTVLLNNSIIEPKTSPKIFVRLRLFYQLKKKVSL